MFPLALVLALMLALSPTVATAQSLEPLPAPLGLDYVLRYARAHRAEITAARAGARAAAQRPAIDSALEDPMVFPSVDHLPFMLHGANVSLTVEQRFPLSGVLGHRRRAAEAAAQGAKADADKVGLDVELDATSAFLMLQESRALELVLREQRALADQLVQAATGRYAAGMGGQADALRSETEVARLDGALRSIAAEIRAAEAMLATSLGRPSDAPVPALNGDAFAESPPDARLVREAALKNRPELRAGNAALSRAQAEVSVMDAMYTPMAMVRTGPAYTMTDGAGWMLMVGISVPIWRSKLRAGVSEAQAMAEMARADLVAMRRMVEGDAVTARERVLGARERFLALRDDIIPRAQRVVEPVLASYSSGQAPLVSVLEAAQTLWASQAELISAQFDLGMAWARLHRAMADEGARR